MHIFSSQLLRDFRGHNKLGDIMSDNDMFNDDKKPDTAATPPKDQDELFADQLKGITNDQGEPKYKDVATALEALKNSQQFIKTLQEEKGQTSTELEQARMELERMGTIESFVNKLNPNATPKQDTVTPNLDDGLSEERVKELLQSQLNQRDNQARQESNLREVTTQLAEVYGDKASDHLRQRAEELGTTVTDLKTLAMTNPKLAMAALGSTPKKTPAPSQSSISLPHTPSDTNAAPQWDKGATRGGMTNKELGERFKESKAYTNKRIGLEN